MIDDLHVKAPRPLSHGLTNPSHTEDTKGLSGDADAQQVALANAITPTLAHDPIVLKSPPSGGKQHHKRVVGGAFRQNAGGVRHDQITLSRSSNVDVIETDATGCPDVD